MKNKLLTSMIGMIFLVTLLVLNVNMASAEVWTWTNTIFPNESIVRYYAYYQIEDTSNDLITIQRPIPIQLISDVETLPYNISQFYPQYPNAYVDWCNYTITWQRNIYDSTYGFTNYQIVNTTLEVTNIFYENTPATFNVTQYYLKARDGLIAQIDCHYTNPDTLFIDNLYFGFITAYIPSFECSGCGEHSFEELINLNKQIEDNNFQQLGLTDKLQQIVDKNFQVWVILYWILKIGLIFLGIVLIFVPLYYFYLLFKSISDGIK